MPKTPRPIKFQLCLTPEEKEQIQTQAKTYGITISELFRCSIQGKLPHKVTETAQKTYLELGRIGNNLNQITKVLNTAQQLGNPIALSTILELRQDLQHLEVQLQQIRREIEQ